LRFGYSLSSSEVSDLLNRARQPFNVNLAAQIAALAALEDHDHLKRSIEMNSAGMEQLTQSFSRLGLDYIPSAGNFLCFKTGKASADVYEALLRQGIIVRPIASYQLPEYLRVTIGTKEQNDRFLDALKNSLS
jgi:histidinol-phosphate aminotransferase